MNLRKILNEIEQADSGAFEQQQGRRELLKSFGAKVAMASLPLSATLFNKAYGKTTGDTSAKVLNFILQMEYMAYNYYHTANNTGGLIPAADQAGFLTIENQKKAHILYLNGVITALGATPFVPKNYDPTSANPLYITSGTYDFTSNNAYPVFSDYPTFIVIAEVLEDTFVHGYLGQIPIVIGDATLLTPLMQMQSDVARHAAHARLVRRFLGYNIAPEHPAPWITNNIPPATPLLNYYAGEENTIQSGGIDILALPGITDTTPKISATAAFDEPLDSETVLTLLKPFMV
jgi:hypothetical protein